MGHLLGLPTELKQLITSYLFSRDSRSYIKSHKKADTHFYPPYEEQNKSFYIWRLIFKDDSWLLDVVSGGLVPVLIGHDLNHLVATLEGSLDCNLHYIHLTFVVNPDRRKDRGKKSPLHTWDLITGSIISQLRCTVVDTRTREARFPGFTLRFTTFRDNNLVDEPYKILHPNGKQTTLLRFDGYTSQMCDTSDIEVTDDQLIIGQNDGTKIYFDY